MKAEKGITLMALIIIVAVLLIIIGVSIQTGTESVSDTMLNGFYTRLQIVQERVDDIASTNESFVDANNNVIYIKKDTGQELTAEQKNKLQDILVQNEISNIDINSFKYFTIQDVKNILDLEEIDYNLFINFENRIVVAEDGITIEDTTYYMLENTKYYVTVNPEKNEGVIKSLKYSDPIKYDNDTYRITIEPEETIGDLDKSGYLKYKKTTSKYWDISNSNYVIIKLDTEYDIIFTDLNKNSIEKVIKIEYEKDEEGNLVQDEEGNNIVIVKEIESEEL